SRTNEITKETTEALESFQTRKAGLACFFEMYEVLKWYQRRAEEMNRAVLDDVLRTWIKLMTPFTPHVCEELWNLLGNEGFVSSSPWPGYNEKLIDEKLDRMEDIVRQTLIDINEIIRLVGKKPKKIYIYTSPEWKHVVYSKIIESKGGDARSIIPAIMRSPEGRKYGKEALRFAQSLVKNLANLKEVLSAEDEYTALKDAERFFEREFKCEVRVMYASESKSEKALRAEPGKPGIEIVSD
ncbi:MAG TPA: leucine--tRNA ligase, partial [Candidatus Aenigmarchaeota archaeon]|nr:leucine--tRNA ligase [Candidatus Aenigmarchaeota archaeon]